jgi:ATP-dependent helicase HrpB
MAELTSQELPIDPLLPELRLTLAEQRHAIVQAAPGAGKTTRVPLALLAAPWLQGRKIIMLEPRRLAVRAAARFMARMLGERVGETVGYRVHLENRVGPVTRIEVVTEGILVRMLQLDPSLDTVGLVIFDEFHERNLASDLGLALCLDSQSALREDLRLLLMSATLDGDAVSRLLGGAPPLSCPGRSYPVTCHYRPVRAHFAREPRDFCREVARQVLGALRDEAGSILVFLPGAGEIRQLATLLRAAPLDDNVLLAPLYGQLTAQAQDAAIQPAPAGRRKVVLATAIAETSLTIEGIRVVIDAGLMRQLRFDPATGLSRLVTVPVSRASAGQRCGRAGRLQPGVCYRLWARQQRLLEHSTPEMLQADLAPLVLELAQWGVRDVSQLRWLDVPPAAHVSQATVLLQQLGALDAAARITSHGRDMLQFGTHPRLAHMMLRARTLGFAALACELAALLGERDPLAGVGERATDITLRVEWLRNTDRAPAAVAPLLRQLRTTTSRWQRQLHCEPSPADQSDLSMAGVLLACAYPDRIARRRPGSHNRFVMSNGRGALFTGVDPLAAEELIVAAHLDDGREARIFLAARVQAEQLRETHAALLSEVTHVSWDERLQCVQARRQLRIGAVILQDQTWQEADPQAVAQALLEGIRRHGAAALPWTTASRELQARLCFMHRLAPQDWPDVSDDALLATLETWLLPCITGMSRLAQLKRLDLHAILRARLDWPAQQRLDELAPAQLRVPSGSRVRVDYTHAIPVLAVRLQELFGMKETPCIDAGRVPLLLHLLSPARRPVQITRDLGAFWRGSYHEVRKELKGRYPKHHWPEDPQTADASAGTRRKPAT